MKKCKMTFVYFDICHRTASVRELYSMTLTYFLTVRNVKQIIVRKISGFESSSFVSTWLKQRSCS